MKKILTVIACALATSGLLASTNAYAIAGTSNLADGYYAGKDATGNYITALGAHSYEGATNSGICVFLGNNSGYQCKSNMTCVGIGHAAFDRAYGCVGCVGIGFGAFALENYKTNCTTINNQFVADGMTDSFWITPNSNRIGEAAPFYYDKGIMYINCDRVVSTAMFSVFDEASGYSTNDFNIYVSKFGSDNFSGKSVNLSKYTLVDAFEKAVSNDTDRICVLSGAYNSPDVYYLKQHTAKVVAISGRENTTICVPSTKVLEGPAKAFLTFEGFTITNATYPSSSPFAKNVMFKDCKIVLDNAYMQNYGVGVFTSCVFDNCELVIDGGGQSWAADCACPWNYFLNCDLIDCKVEITQAFNTSVSYATCFNNCFVQVFNGTTSASADSEKIINTPYALTNGQTTVLGNTIAAYSSTFDIWATHVHTNAGPFNLYAAYGSDTGGWCATNKCYFVGDYSGLSDNFWGTDNRVSISHNAEGLDTDSDDYAKNLADLGVARLYGCGSYDDRLARTAIQGDTLNTLLDCGIVSKTSAAYTNMAYKLEQQIDTTGITMKRSIAAGTAIVTPTVPLQ